MQEARRKRVNWSKTPSGGKKGKFLHLVPQNGTLQLNGHSLALIGGNNPGPTAPATKALTSIF